MIVAKAAELVEVETSNEVKIAQKCQPLLWFGVSAQKRLWIEQVEGGAKIISELAKIYPNLGVVFDGWTCPDNPKDSDLTETIKDRALAEQITRLLPEKVMTFNVVGTTTIRKLAFANVIDAFIANSATGSIHVARFARKPGVGHMNTRLPTESNLSYQTLKVPCSQIVDIPNPDPKLSDAQFISYSINPDVILSMIKKILA